MTDQLIQQLILQLQNLSPQLWQILLKQVSINNFTNLAWTIILFIFLITCVAMIFVSKKKYEWGQSEDNYSDTSGWGLAAWLFGFGAFIFGLIFFATLSSTIQGFLNPQYWAIYNLLSAFSQSH
jgi:hypothetical protein